MEGGKEGGRARTYRGLASAVLPDEHDHGLGVELGVGEGRGVEGVVHVHLSRREGGREGIEAREPVVVIKKMLSESRQRRIHDGDICSHRLASK